jgi:hypothetical protein
MERTVVRCRMCGLELSASAVEIPGAPCPISDETGVDGIPAGVFFRAQAADVWDGATRGSVVIHRGDQRNMTPCGVRIGCCGTTGSDGPNLACAAGHVVATEVADCCTPHFVFFTPDAIVLRAPTPDASMTPVHVFRASAEMSNAWPFHTWLHETLEASDWFGEDIGSLARWWLAANEGALTIVVLGSAGARASGMPLDELAAAARASETPGHPRRFALLLV